MMFTDIGVGADLLSMRSRIAALPQSIKHIVVITTVPIVFPKLPLSEVAMSTIDKTPLVKGALQKTGIGAGIVDKCDCRLPPAHVLIPAGAHMTFLAETLCSAQRVLHSRRATEAPASFLFWCFWFVMLILVWRH